MQILGLLGMYFDAVVVEVEKYLPFFRLALAILFYKVLHCCYIVIFTVWTVIYIILCLIGLALHFEEEFLSFRLFVQINKKILIVEASIIHSLRENFVVRNWVG